MGLPTMPEKFDIIFLRNILIYFKTQDRKHIVKAVLRQLHAGALLLPGHTESINGFHQQLNMLQPHCYQWQLS